ncbi:DNA-binding protein [Thiospirochaeta perfilievii]|uniref:DNA-binding protein n=1 Tax=Thiospirochaeta perfilievii TaxID=252967 RepID=A0A5C1QIV1_9SPIO|nr:hemolysin III family protein [Thiospirochaeta perfilievii]QEN06102.1 DNA-binding protein [Thiospirochaeta perfilievii]
MEIKNWLLENITLHSHDNKREEFINGLTHFFGIILSIIGIIFLLLKNTTTPHLKGATIVYGLTMLLLFTASTIYHWLNDPILKRVGRVLDHCNIYLLIAGTYTPLAIYIGGRMGVTIILFEWVLTVLGIIFTLKFWGRLKFLHVFFYLVMGWMIVLVWSDFIKLVPISFAKDILLGGVLYTIGVIIYSLKKIPYYHGIWHLFVVAGAASMYIGIYTYLS